MYRRQIFFAFAALLAGAIGATAQPADTELTSDVALEIFEPLIGGEWHLDATVQIFEWGPGKRSIIARSYVVDGAERRQVSHGMWYWHPEKKAVVGHAVATGMPIELFEYTSRREGGVLIHELATWTPDGTPGRYIETWELSSPDIFEWRLLLPRPDVTEELMTGTFRRQ